MCGRFHNHVKAMQQWGDVLQDWPGDATLSYNISPTQLVPVVTSAGYITARWGLVPPWEKQFSTQYPTHNARLETAKDKPSFRSAWKHSRTCLIPAGGFYEWRKEGSNKQAYFIHKPHDLLVFAGLWEQWNHRHSFTILTTGSQGSIAQLHHRMPVMLDAGNAARWLESSTDGMDILQGSQVFEAVDYYSVGAEVNNSGREGAALVERCDAVLPGLPQNPTV